METLLCSWGDSSPMSHARRAFILFILVSGIVRISCVALYMPTITCTARHGAWIRQISHRQVVRDMDADDYRTLKRFRLLCTRNARKNL